MRRLISLAVAAGLLASCATSRPVVYQITPQPRGSDTPPAVTIDSNGKKVSLSSLSAPALTQPSPAVEVTLPTPLPSSLSTPSVPAMPPSVPAMPVKEFLPPADSPLSANTPLPKESPAQTVARITNAEEIKPTAQTYNGGTVVQPYYPNYPYQLYTARFQISIIKLEPGEHIVSPPAAGDTGTFLVGTSYFVEDSKKREVVLVKPLFADRTTTLAIMTDRRAYIFKVFSFQNTYMPIYSFTYPDEEMQLNTAAAEASAKSTTDSGDIPVNGFYITNLDFGYNIIPHSISLPHWAPSLVFNDGKKTYINFASASRASYAPALFDIDTKGNRTLLNFHIKGNYYIVDKVILHAELILDINDGNVITIMHKD